MGSFSAATLNVRAGGFVDYSGTIDCPPRISAIQKAVTLTGASVVGLIDTFRWRELYTTDELCALFGYPQAFHIDMDCEVVDSRVGLTVLGGKNLIGCEAVRIHDRNCLRVDLKVDGRPVCLYVIYLTSLSGARRRRQTEALLEYIDARPQVPTLIMGDLNTLRPESFIGPARLLNSVLRLLPSVPAPLGRFAEAFELTHTEALSLLREAGFSDEMRGMPAATFQQRVLGLDIKLALDYCLSRHIEVKDCTVLRGKPYEAASDHFPVMATL